MTMIVVVFVMAMLPTAVFASAPASDSLKWQARPVENEDPPPEDGGSPPPEEPVVVVVPSTDPPGVPPPIGFTTENAVSQYENGPAVGYDANGVVPVTQSLSVTRGPFDPPALVHMPTAEGYDPATLVLARWDEANNLWVLVPGSGPCGDWICGYTSTDGVFAVVEAGWFNN